MEKKFTGYLIINWRTGDMRMRKKKPDKYSLGTFEIPIRVEINIKLPEQKEIVARGNITLPEEKVAEMVIEEA